MGRGMGSVVKSTPLGEGGGSALAAGRRRRQQQREDKPPRRRWSIRIRSCRAPSGCRNACPAAKTARRRTWSDKQSQARATTDVALPGHIDGARCSEDRARGERRRTQAASIHAHTRRPTILIPPSAGPGLMYVAEFIPPKNTVKTTNSSRALYFVVEQSASFDLSLLRNIFLPNRGRSRAGLKFQTAGWTAVQFVPDT